MNPVPVQQPVVTLPVPWPLYVLGSLIVWLIKATFFAIAFLIFLLWLVIWVPLSRTYRLAVVRHRGEP